MNEKLQLAIATLLMDVHTMFKPWAKVAARVAHGAQRIVRRANKKLGL